MVNSLISANPVESYAIIINGDTNPKDFSSKRHIRNTKLAAKAFKAEGAQKVFTVSNYAEFEKAVKELKTISDSNDHISVYFTGHGGNVGGQATAQFTDGYRPYSALAPLLNQLSYGSRFVFMDHCNSGLAYDLFNDNRSLIHTLGFEDQLTACGEYIPAFFSEQADLNQDGSITIQERFQHALSTTTSNSIPQLFDPSPKDHDTINGEKVTAGLFSTDVTLVTTQTELEKELAALKPGQHAIVVYSSNTCPACDDYEPIFQAKAQEYNGLVKMIIAKDIDGSANSWSQSGVKLEGFPTAVIHDDRGNHVAVPLSQRNDPLALLTQMQVDPKQMVKSLIQNLVHQNPEQKLKTLKTLNLLPEQSLNAAQLERVLKILMGETNTSIFNNPDLSDSLKMDLLTLICKNYPDILSSDDVNAIFRTYLHDPKSNQKTIDILDDYLKYSSHTTHRKSAQAPIMEGINNPNPKVKNRSLLLIILYANP